VDEISAAFAGDRDFELQRVETWALVVKAMTEMSGMVNRSRTKKIAKHVDWIAAQFAGDRDFELPQAEIRTYVTGAMRATNGP
jgi:hypothetical protein